MRNSQNDFCYFTFKTQDGFNRGVQSQAAKWKPFSPEPRKWYQHFKETATFHPIKKTVTLLVAVIRVGSSSH
jgi:hypothetical protein